MSTNKQKLELTWIGKNNPDNDIANIEPRILEERKDLSNGDKDTENILIHGDNLLALKALLPEFEGKVKCIYIDPPFNTGSAFDHYDDSVEHSTWLSLMKSRIELFRMLLSDDGVIYVHIDYNEEAYLRILMDEIFGRKNFRNTFIVSRVKKSIREREKVKALNFAHDVVLFYSKQDETVIMPPTKKVVKEERWHGMDAPGFRNGMDYELFGTKPSALRHWAWTRDNAFKAISNYDIWLQDFSKQMSLTEYWESTGSKLRFIRKNSKSGKPEYFLPASTEEILDTNWTDIQASAFRWNFPNGEKNEFLIQRILEMSTLKNDLVLDSFLGSGTTCAVAHKMGRKYIGIEMGDHAYTHCKVRIDKVIDGTDQGGISKTIDWKGGGGYKFFELAPSFVIIDEFGNPVIDSYYNDIKLIRAMCKLTNYTFAPSQTEYWKHGKGQGNNSIYITTQLLTIAIVQQIANHLKANETLLICPKKFEPGCQTVDTRITIKKIPQSILKACQFGKKEYLLPVNESAIEEFDEEELE
ncbi:MAG: site-specific DNA-methyltransferase [Bacteroidota bacterium]|nr:site-specific DNA-methyltransferase [Bacteroidota bacterium]